MKKYSKIIKWKNLMVINVIKNSDVLQGNYIDIYSNNEDITKKFFTNGY